ncbi:hypothetical protein DIS24_g12630, partial [Lasiodiplodia hormozganensis]
MQPPKFFRKSQDYAGIEQTDNLLPTDEKTPTNTRRRLPYNIFFYTSIALLNIVVGLLIGYLAASEESASSFGINPIPRKILTNRHDVRFSPNSDYMGPGHTPARYGLQDPGIHAPFFIFSEPPAAAAADAANANNFYVLNNLHQLHCVNMIRMRYNSLVYHRDATDPLAKTPIDEDWIRHLEHCFEYFRLSVTCADYLTFESDSPPGSPEEYWKDGLSWGVVHSCVDWDALMGWQRSQVV